MRLIDAGDAYIVLVDEYHLRSVAQSYALMEALDKVPTIDAVPVIRCKDCKYYEETDSRIGTCLLTISGAEVNGFCAWGERGEDADN